MSKTSVIHFERQPVQGWHSIERVFDTVRESLKAEYGFRVVHCPTPAHSRFWLPLGLWRARRLRAEVMHVVGDVHYVTLGLTGAQTILTVHDLNRFSGLHGLRRLLFRWIYLTLPLKRCAAVTAISEDTRNQLVQMFPWVESKIHVIPDSVPYGFKPLKKAFNSREPRILHLGTAPNKNLARLAESLHGRPCLLQIVGRLSEEQRQMLRTHRISYSNVVDISDARLIAMYEQADIVAFVSLAEGFGMPIIEAQAIGRPVLTSDLSPMKEVAGAGACLVNPWSVAEIRAGLDRIIEDQAYRDGLTAAALENVKRFDPVLVAKQYAELYRRVGKSF